MQSKLIILRKERNLTQKELANALDISLQAYRNKESGKAQFVLKEIFAISIFFNKPIEEIFLPTN